MLNKTNPFTKNWITFYLFQQQFIFNSPKNSNTCSSLLAGWFLYSCLRFYWRLGWWYSSRHLHSSTLSSTMKQFQAHSFTTETNLLKSTWCQCSLLPLPMGFQNCTPSCSNTNCFHLNKKGLHFHWKLLWHFPSWLLC